jgi:transcriptional regulator with XRE-family HTH domain
MKREAFGSLLRSLREGQGKSMSALARHLDVSPAYLCEVEQGRRTPLTRENIRKAAAFLHVDPLPLVAAALEWNGTLELNVTKCSAKGKKVGATLALRWDTLAEKDFEAIARILKQKEVTTM